MRLGDHVAGAREFVVERVQQEQRVALLRRREQGGQEPVRVMATDDLAGRVSIRARWRVISVLASGPPA